MKQLVMRVCSRERLNPRHHSLQYIDFKHEFLDMATTVDGIEVNQIRLMDKRGKLDWDRLSCLWAKDFINVFPFITIIIKIIKLQKKSQSLTFFVVKHFF